MAQLILTHSNSFHRAIRTQNAFPITLRVGKFFLLFSIALMIGVVSFLYLVESTEIQTRGFQLRKMEIERFGLENERETKNTEISRLRSLSNIRESNVTRSLVPMRNPIFIKKDGSIASLTGPADKP